MEDIYAIIDINDLLKVDFTQVGQTSENTVRKSLDNSKFVLKWQTMPTFITDGTIVPLHVLTHEDCLELMNTSEWTNNIE